MRDKGLRAVIVTVRGGLIELRPKGLRRKEFADVASIYYSAVKARVAQEKADKKLRRKK